MFVKLGYGQYDLNSLLVVEVVKTIVILAGVAGLVVQDVEDLPDTESNDGTQDWADPVDPVVVGERLGSHTRTKGSGWVKTSTGVVDTDQVSQEQSDTDGHRSDEGSSVLLDSHQQDGQTKQTGTESLDEHTSGSGASSAQSVGKCNRTGSHGRSSTSCSHTSNHLRHHHQGTSDRRNGTSQDQGQGDGRVQVTTRNSEEHEHSDHDTETETERDHDQLLRIGSLGRDVRILVGNLGDHKSGPQKDKGSKELTQDSNEVVLPCWNRRGRWSLGLVRVFTLGFNVTYSSISNFSSSHSCNCSKAGARGGIYTAGWLQVMEISFPSKYLHDSCIRRGWKLGQVRAS